MSSLQFIQDPLFQAGRRAFVLRTGVALSGTAVALLAGHQALAAKTLKTTGDSAAADIELLLTNMAYAVVGRVADGELPAAAMLPTLERAVHRLTANNEPDAARAAKGR